MIDEFMTVKEVRQVMRLGETKMYALLGEGQLKAIKIGRKILISRASVNEFLSSQPDYRP